MTYTYIHTHKRGRDIKLCNRCKSDRRKRVIKSNMLNTEHTWTKRLSWSSLIICCYSTSLSIFIALTNINQCQWPWFYLYLNKRKRAGDKGRVDWKIIFRFSSPPSLSTHVSNYDVCLLLLLLLWRDFNFLFCLLNTQANLLLFFDKQSIHWADD